MIKKGFIVKVNAGLYRVFSDGKYYDCRARGRFRHREMTPVCGDFVEFDSEALYLLDIGERRNHFIRPPIANIDQIVVIASLVEPAISLNLINRFVTLAEVAQMKPIIVLTKIDLIKDKKEYEHILSNFSSLHYDVHLISNKQNIGIEELKGKLKGVKSVFTGQSGVGKSTLLNQLLPHLNLKTAKISEALGRGKHTTRTVQFIAYEDGWIADTPGFSAIEFDIDEVELASSFPGFEHFYQQCNFRNCLHDKEPKCFVKKNVEEGIISKEHYEIYLSLLEEIRSKKEKY